MEKYRYYRMKDDAQVLEEITSIIKLRPSYGYKRVTALINKKRIESGRKTINKKKVFRVMKMNNLILPKKSNPTKKREKTGKVMTLKSNTRWCSDCFEIRCFNGEKVYVTFSLDTCDREVLAWRAIKRPIQAEDIERLMIDSVSSRFLDYRTPHRIQWLTDRGKVYRSYSTKNMAIKLGLIPCFTRAYSPESNGMAEAFVGRFKKDYVYVNDCETADSTIKMMEKWFEDYNNFAPHSALGMKSPREFKKLTQV